MSACADFIAWTPLASHAATLWLERNELPADPERLADALYGQPSPFGGVERGSLELVLGAAPIGLIGKELFEVAPDDGKWAVLQPITTPDNDILDLVAWHPAEPSRWRLLRGDGEALGEREIALRQDGDGPLKVFATPLSWHRAGGRGVCLLRREWQVAQRLFIGETELIAETVELGTSLDRALRFRPAPKILMQSLERAA